MKYAWISIFDCGRWWGPYTLLDIETQGNWSHISPVEKVSIHAFGERGPSPNDRPRSHWRLHER